MKLPNLTTSKETATPVEAAGATPPNSRKRPLSAANSQVGPLRPPSRALPMGHWGPALCAPQIAIPDSRLHLTTSSRPRSRFNSVSFLFDILPSISRENKKKLTKKNILAVEKRVLFVRRARTVRETDFPLYPSDPFWKGCRISSITIRPPPLQNFHQKMCVLVLVVFRRNFSSGFLLQAI